MEVDGDGGQVLRLGVRGAEARRLGRARVVEEHLVDRIVYRTSTKQCDMHDCDNRATTTPPSEHLTHKQYVIAAL